MTTFYQDITRALRKMLVKNISGGEMNVDMVMTTIEKTFVAEFVVNAVDSCKSHKKGYRYNKGYDDAMLDMVSFFKESYGDTSRTLVAFDKD